MSTALRTASASSALLLVDFINPLRFNSGPAFTGRVERAAARAAVLKTRLRARGVPVIYANDHFGAWTSDFSALVAACVNEAGPSARVAKRLAPEAGDYPVLKPRHSAFFGTPLEFLLAELGVRRLIIAGLQADSCVLFTAADAYLRRFDLWVPADCVAAEHDAHRRQALAHMARVLKADVRSSATAHRERRSAARTH